jgi:TonB family protein
MGESPNRWVGQIADSKFPLQQFLGGTNHSAVFLTHLPDAPSQPAAIKLIQVGAASVNLQLSRWRAAALLSHPNLLRIFGSGSCGIAGMNFLYLVTEHAPENLSQILPERSLTPDETRDMLQPILAALSFLHEKNLIYGHVCPANILAIEDKVKLSSDSIFPAGESRIDSRDLDIYDAPELVPSSVYESADVWSLATTLVEVLTQKLPARRDDLQLDPTFPEDLSEPFLEIVRRSLALDPTRRWTIPGIAAHLSPKPPLAAAATASPAATSGIAPAATAVASAAAPAAPTPAASSAPPISPLAVRLSSVSPIPPTKIPERIPYAPPPTTKRSEPPTASRPKFLIPAIALVLFFVALFAIPKFFNRRTDTSASLSPVASAPRASVPAKADSKAALAKSSASSAPAPQPASAKERIAHDQSITPAKSPAVAAPVTKISDSAAPAEPPARSTPRGEVLDQVLPQISDRARATIQGKVRVAIRVQVDAAGNVSDAQFDSPGPSKAFADLALEAARKWEFTPPEFSGHSVPSIWTIRFEIGPSDTKVLTKQVEP